MSRLEILEKIRSCGIIAVIRMGDTQKLEKVISAISRGGVKGLEITMTTPNALDVIHRISAELPDDFLIGVGSVLDAQTAVAAIHAGAQFVVSPVFKEEIIEAAHRYDRVVIPGAFTPTEILSAWESGADVVKVFPATVGGPKYFRDILGPLPQVKLTPTGGVNLDNAADFMKAGAFCLGVGTALLNKQFIAENRWDELTQLASKFISKIRIS